MLSTNYAKLSGGYPEYLHLPVELKSSLIIQRCDAPHGKPPPMTMRQPKELGYKPVTRSPCPQRRAIITTEKYGRITAKR